VDAELSRLETAGKKSVEQLQKLYEKALKEVGEGSAQFLKYIR